jgi:hypothetical protein
MAKDYKNNAKELKKTTRWSNWKLNLAIGVPVTGILGYLIWSFLK